MTDDTKKDNLHVIKTQTDDLTKNLAVVKSKIDQIIEYHLIVAKIRKAVYDKHIENGFTPDQALELTKMVNL